MYICWHRLRYSHLDSIKFFKEAFKSIKTSGTVIPSSKFLVKELIAPIDFTSAKVIVEFGPGNGIITKAILERLHPEAKLLCFEINESFYQSLQRINNPQFILVKESAECIQDLLDQHALGAVDYIVSSLPLTNIPKVVTDAILQNSYNALKPQGKFIQYQYSLTYYKTLKRVFKDNVDLNFEPLNLPPAFVYVAEK